MGPADSGAAVSMPEPNNSSYFRNGQYGYEHEPIVQVALGGMILNVPESAAAEISKYRKTSMVAGGMAITSLIIGGVILGTIALFVAIHAYRKLNEIAGRFGAGSPGAAVVKRTGRTALLVCIGALALNAIVLAMVWPIAYQFAQNNDIEGLIQYFQTGQLPSGIAGGTGGNGSSVW